MRPPYTKTFLVSSLALALLLGGGTLYSAKHIARAESSEAPSAVSGAVKDKELKPDREGRQEKLPIYEEAATLLGMDKETLMKQLKSETLVQIAAAKGISETDLIAKLQAERTKKIEEAVASGKLTAEKAEKLKAHMEKHLKFMVNHPVRSDKAHHGKAGKGRFDALPAPEKLASILGITEEQLKSELKAGKSMTEIAASKGMSKEQLVAKIKEELTPWIEKAVDRKHESKQK
ncbi:hypothetical protein [Paenibacillus silviterrae]|uniref:hypothetical protein n=1 Tax=Paenibacillus silviterrae TaxID=3242194 RepID=UPI002543B7A4|nr:hypothetical protein [Paenibacillus chinjuensis]